MEIVIDPKGVVAGGKCYPAGTPLDQIPATAGDVAAWRRFQQVGEPQAPAAEPAPAIAPEVPAEAPAVNASPAKTPAAKKPGSKKS